MAATHADVWQRATVVENVALTDSIRRIVFEPAMPIAGAARRASRRARADRWADGSALVLDRRGVGRRATHRAQRVRVTALARRRRCHACALGRRRARGDPTAARLPAAHRRCALRAARRRHRHHGRARHGAGAAADRRRLHAGVCGSQPRGDGVRRLPRRRARRAPAGARRRRGELARGWGAGCIHWPRNRAVHVRSDPTDGCRAPRLDRTRTGCHRPALRDVRQQRLARRRGVHGAHPATRHRDVESDRGSRCSRHSSPPVPT